MAVYQLEHYDFSPGASWLGGISQMLQSAYGTYRSEEERKKQDADRAFMMKQALDRADREKMQDSIGLRKDAMTEAWTPESGERPWVPDLESMDTTVTAPGVPGFIPTEAKPEPVKYTDIEPLVVKGKTVLPGHHIPKLYEKEAKLAGGEYIRATPEMIASMPDAAQPFFQVGALYKSESLLGMMRQALTEQGQAAWTALTQEDVASGVFSGHKAGDRVPTSTYNQRTQGPETTTEETIDPFMGKSVKKTTKARAKVGSGGTYGSTRLPPQEPQQQPDGEPKFDQSNLTPDGDPEHLAEEDRLRKWADTGVRVLPDDVATPTQPVKATASASKAIDSETSAVASPWVEPPQSGVMSKATGGYDNWLVPSYLVATPPPQKPSAIPRPAGVGGIDWNLTGEPFLAQLQPPMAKLVKALGSYVQSPQALGRMSPNSRALALTAAHAFNPAYDDKMYTVRSRSLLDFTSAKGTGAGGNIVALRTAVHHLGILNDLQKELTASPVQGFNRLVQYIKTNFMGKPAVTNYTAAANAVETELATLLKRTGATDQEIAVWRNVFKPYLSNRQLSGAVATTLKLMKGRADSLQATWHDAQGEDAPDFPIYKKREIEVLQSILGSEGMGQTGATTGPLPKIESLEITPIGGTQ